MAGVDDQDTVQVDENFDFQKHLENSDFTEYDKIKGAIEKGEISLEDILDLTETEIKDVLGEYGVKTIQKRRFVKAIKQLPNSKIHRNSQNNSNNNNNDEASTGAVSPKSVFLSEKEQSIINQFSSTADLIANNLTTLETYHNQFKQNIKAGKDKLTLVYNKAMQQLIDLEMSDEKEYESNVTLLSEYRNECNELRKEYETFIISNGKDDINKSINMTEKIDSYNNKMQNNIVNAKSVNIDIDNIKLELKAPDVYETRLYNFDRSSMIHNGGILSICGRNDKILNNGKTFHSKQDCLARTNDAIMIDNSGIYKIKWKINTFKCYNGYNTIGICTDYYKSNSNESRSSWMESQYYIGWCGYQHKQHSLNRLLCGFGEQSNNIFYESCQFIGDSLPQYKENDTISLIYDSNKNELSFELNDEKLNSKLTNIPKKLNLFWFVARWQDAVKFSIVN